MGFEHILVERSGEFATVTMNRPQRRNALSLEHMRELITAFGDLGHSDVLGIVLAGNGPVFSSGHDLAEVADTSLPQIRSLLATCTELMTLMQQVPQPVVARVHGLATAAGCQLVASADLAVASEDAGFATPGGKGGWFCHTPMVAVARNVGRKRAAELAMSGDVIDARTALEWGLVNRVVPAAQLDSAVQDLLDRVTRGVGLGLVPRLGGQQGHRQAGAVRPDRPGPGQGLRLRHRGHGRDQPASRSPRMDARLPGKAQAQLGPRPPLGHAHPRQVRDLVTALVASAPRGSLPLTDETVGSRPWPLG